MSPKIDSRLQKLRQKLAGTELDAILISQPENRYYLSGFNGSAGYLLITPREAVIATDFRYIEQAKTQCPDYRIFQIAGDAAKWLPDLLAELKPKRMGFEASDITFTMYRRFSGILKEPRLQLELVPTDGLAETLRSIKEPEEIELITRAAEITDSTCDDIENWIRAGMSEKEAAWEIEKSLREGGSQGIAFDVIIASGPNTALPHAQPSESRISSGEPILIDIGAKVGGYCADLSRTICLGARDDTFNKVYDTVLGAQLAAIAMINEGMTGEEADGIAREIIEQGGYGEAFGHSLGHGVGLAPHEQPRLGPGSPDHLADGMVFTIEPGIYLPGWGGVRIEDLAVMENGKVKLLSKARKILI
jgi:Xaa-Pro aminopeptidase